MDQELRAYLEDLKASIGNQATAIEDLRTSVGNQATAIEDLKASFDQRFAEQRRHTEILIEGVRSEVRLVAEGVEGVSERLETFRADTAHRFEETQASFAPYYRGLDGRMVQLEEDLPVLERRVSALETRASRRAGKKGPTTQ